VRNSRSTRRMGESSARSTPAAGADKPKQCREHSDALRIPMHYYAPDYIDILYDKACVRFARCCDGGDMQPGTWRPREAKLAKLGRAINRKLSLTRAHASASELPKTQQMLVGHHCGQLSVPILKHISIFSTGSRSAAPPYPTLAGSGSQQRHSSSCLPYAFKRGAAP
jgi:hypothetical protein